MIRKAIFLVSLVLVTQEARTSEAALNAFFVDTTHLSADFIQKVEDESGSLLEISSGKFYLSRPGKFRWDYENPDFPGEMGQQIIADGQSLFFYDPDLDQVSQRPLDAALAQVPSLLLVQQGGDVSQHFIVTDFGLTDGLTWVSLKPKDVDAAYRQLMIGFSGKSLASLLLYDGLGNSTSLKFSNVALLDEQPNGVFDFEVPEGADLLREY